MYGSDVTAVGKEGKTLLHEAAGYWDVAVARFLIAKGADVNAEDQHGFTPLFAAIAENANIEVFKYLVSQGATVNGEDDTTESLLALAKEMDNSAIVEYLTQVCANGIESQTRIKDFALEQLDGCKEQVAVFMKLKADAIEAGDEVPIFVHETIETFRKLSEHMVEIIGLCQKTIDCYQDAINR